jgi:hypothetical protein
MIKTNFGTLRIMEKGHAYVTEKVEYSKKERYFLAAVLQ